MKTLQLVTIVGALALLFNGCQKDELLDNNPDLSAPIEQRINCDAAAAIDQASAIISELSGAGLFTGTGFLNRLNTIEHKINAGQTAVAVNLIHSMLNVFDAMHRNGVINDEQYALLSTALTRIIGAANGEGMFTDPRDGQSYRWVLLPDCQIWMAENLNFATPGSWWYNNNPANGEVYGRLYTHSAAMQACPEGWRLPTYLEWQTMTNYYGGLSLAGGTDPEAAYASLISPIHGGNGASGFDAVLGGVYYNGNSEALGEAGVYWTSTPFNVNLYWRLLFSAQNQFIQPAAATATPSLGYSCRCIMGDPPTQPVVVSNGNTNFCSYEVPTPTEPNCTGPVQLILNVSSTCSGSVLEEVVLYLYNYNQSTTGYTFTPPDASGNFVINMPNAPLGAHKFRIKASDNCGNINYSEVSFTLNDCKSPVPICINGLVASLTYQEIDNQWMPAIQLSPFDFLAATINDCSLPLTYYIIKVKELPGQTLANLTAEWLTPERTSAVFTCEDEGVQQIGLVVRDAAGNFDYCETYVVIGDGQSLCDE